VLLSDSMIFTNFNHIFSFEEYISRHLNIWLNNLDQFVNDLLCFSDFIQNRFPKLSDNFYVYALFTSWIVDEVSKIGIEFYSRIVEHMLIQLCGMALWKETNNLDITKFSIIISEVDRRIEHVSNLFPNVEKALNSLAFDKDILLTMMAI